MTIVAAANMLDEAKNRRLEIPRHIAVIMDGNGRWAKSRGLNRIDGHREGVRSTREIVEACGELGVKFLTLYTFSSENWRRPLSEINSLMELLLVTVREELENLERNNVQLRVIGRLQDLPLGPRQAMEFAIRRLKKNTGLVLNLAISYGARQEILEAVRALVKEGAGEVSEDQFSAKLGTAGQVDPDLLIRTSGEMRLSNFLLWQLAYTEIVVTPVMWPEFRRPQLLEAISEFNKRKRRFGALDEAK